MAIQIPTSGARLLNEVFDLLQRDLPRLPLDDGADEIGELFAVTVDELRDTNDADRALIALSELWARVEDVAMLREAISDAGADWLWDALLVNQIKGGDA
jgi:hypothetical protein